MGALLALFNTNELKNFELHWSEIEVEAEDKILYEECGELLKRCNEVLEQMTNYTGGKEEIRLAMIEKQGSDESHQAIRTAMVKIIPGAAYCQEWMDLAKEIAQFLKTKLLPRLSTPLMMMEEENESNEEMKNDEYIEDNTNNANTNVKKNVSELTVLTHQALVKQCVLILEFALAFDEKKMFEPQIQNDFSFYKRTLNRRNMEYLSDLSFPVSCERAGFVSMFLAQAIPMNKEIATNVANDSLSLKMFATIANSCLALLKANKFDDDIDHQRIALRAMVSAFVIYDHSSEYGAFQRRSETKAGKIISMVTSDYESLYGEKDHLTGLNNIIKYTSAHFNDSTTPSSIVHAFDDV